MLEADKKELFQGLLDLDREGEVDAQLPRPKRARRDGDTTPKNNGITEKKSHQKQSTHTKSSLTKKQKKAASKASKSAPASDSAKSTVDDITNKPHALTKAKSPIPEADQFLKGQALLSIPFDHIGPRIRSRLAQAASYGADVVREYSASVTLIVVQIELDYNRVLDRLGKDALHDGVHVVNESYLADCLMTRFLIDPTRPNYRIKSAPEVIRTNGVAARHIKSERDRRLACARRQSSASPDRGSEASDCISPQQADRGAPAENDHVENATVSESVLEAAIEEARTLPEVIFASDDEDDGPEEIRDELSDSEEERVATEPAVKSSIPAWQCHFTCMSKNDGILRDKNANARTIELFQQMCDFHDRSNDQWRTLAYRKAITQLKRQDHRIMTAKEAIKLRGIGPRLAKRIEEIVQTDGLRRLENARLEPHELSTQLFLRIHGVGYNQARKWVDRGYRTLDDLRQHVHLSETQQCGLDHIDDFNARIPRAEISKHVEYICDFAKRHVDPGLEFTVGGSYRRGADTSGDIDFIVTKQGTSLSHIRSLMLETMVPKLYKAGYLRATLASSRRWHASTNDDGFERGKTQSKWHGAATLPHALLRSLPGAYTAAACPEEPDARPWRRIDFLFVPPAEMGAALIYFTGNDIFNRSMRLLARKKGMRLNQQGLYKDVHRGPNGARLTEGKLVASKTEQEIFGVLGVPWRPAGDRVC